MFSDEEVQKLYKKARREVAFRMRGHRGPWPDWTQDVIQTAVMEAFEAGWVGNSTQQGKLIRKVVRREIDKELNQ